ncbi:hypothetical protein N7533_005517 [Penicillium manginii]|uniref:uncharacterized protein n=1 Tax=Penicillium manginii TaxID=203109 RepID=UPI0025484D6B|nr:uncharacterized protein N7533_005517 [Penicillium manginii]KAJ5755974.1 hypothetical protein N7533_005517 [Penicillium manginii]
MEPPKGFHLFGGCMLEIPSTEELAEASRWTATQWNFGPDFEQMAKRDTETWKQLGVERPHHLLRPSGP